MFLYYAMGGGLGHLTRARAFLHTLNLEKNSIILTSSTYVSDKRVVGDIPVVVADRHFEKDIQAFQEYLQNLFQELKIKTIFIDAFPFGIIGEFSEFEFSPDIEVNYIARLLRWKNYLSSKKSNLIKFNETFILEDLETEHQKFIDETSSKQLKIKLKYPTENLSQCDEIIFNSILNKSPFWLIVHSGNEEEINELVSFAIEMREIEKAKVNLILISPNDFSIQKNNLFHFNLYPASILFETAERIFSASGFNIMQQCEDFRDKHFFIPFERRYDDQFARAKSFR